MLLTQKIELVKQAQAAELDQYQQHATDLITAMQEQVGQIAQQGKDAGESFIQGIIEGMAAGAQNLQAAMTERVQAAIDALKKYLGIASPSKLFQMAIGEPIGEGIAVGIQAKAMLLADSTHKAVQGSFNTASSVVNNWNLNANININSSQPRYSPRYSAMRIVNNYL
jgi:hypothetical protein